MPTARRVEDLECWQGARRLVSEVYRQSAQGPLARDYALQNQLRRASISILANIAEGFDRYGPAEFHRFLGIAKASSVELRALLLIARDVGSIAQSDHDQLSAEASALADSLGKLMKYLRTKRRRA
ncbi:MAG: four helix bundle protein [bacterium]